MQLLNSRTRACGIQALERRGLVGRAGGETVITLARGPDGSLTTTLPDHRGRDVRYRLRPLADGTGVEMERDDGDGLYVARRGRHGWTCNCKAFAFSKAQPPVCKHTIFSAEYLDLVGRVLPGGRGAGFVQVT